MNVFESLFTVPMAVRLAINPKASENKISPPVIKNTKKHLSKSVVPYTSPDPVVVTMF